MMNELSEKEKKFRVYLVTLAFALFSVLLFGFIYLATTPAKTLNMVLSFSGGISNIVLPCTLPLVFIIVPLAMAEVSHYDCPWYSHRRQTGIYRGAEGGRAGKED